MYDDRIMHYNIELSDGSTDLRAADLDINPVTLKSEGHPDILKLYEELHAKNKAARLESLD